MNVCILSIALARQINLPENEIQDIGLCGMMHDMGKMKIPLEILNKPGRFKPEEFDIMKTHPALGMKMLMTSDGMPGCVIDAAYAHHEQIEGKKSKDSIKLKPINTDELTVTEIFENGYLSLVDNGGITAKIKVGSHILDHVKIGSIIEIAFDYIGEKYNQARFIDIRLDKQVV